MALQATPKNGAPELFVSPGRRSIGYDVKLFMKAKIKRSSLQNKN